MALNNDQKEHIEDVIKKSLRKKFLTYSPESKHMPFHFTLLGKDRMALYSFIQSLNTTFGTSIFEPVAAELAKVKSKNAEPQYFVGDRVSVVAQAEIQKIMNDLTMGKDPNKTEEIERIRKVCREGVMSSLKPIKADLFVENDEGVFLFDLKTVKPNKGNFKEFKRMLLEWVAVFLAKNPEAKINTLIALPYNPYEPKPYERWTLKGMLELKNELKVASEFWDFLGGEGAYEDLLKCFENAGLELRQEIDEYFKKFK